MTYDAAVIERIDHLIERVDRIAAGSEEVLTTEQFAVRVGLTTDQVKARMRKGVLPMGRVWFQPVGLGPYFLWSRFCEFVAAEGDTEKVSSAAQAADEPEEDRIGSWRERGR